MSQRQKVLQAVDGEREYQDRKWGSLQEHPLTQGEWLLVLETELAEAKAAWAKNSERPHSVLDEVRQVAAVAVACMEQHGYWHRDHSAAGAVRVNINMNEEEKEAAQAAIKAAVTKWNEENVGVHGSGKGAFVQMPRSEEPPPVPESLRRRTRTTLFRKLTAEEMDAGYITIEGWEEEKND